MYELDCSGSQAKSAGDVLFEPTATKTKTLSRVRAGGRARH